MYLQGFSLSLGLLYTFRIPLQYGQMISLTNNFVPRGKFSVAQSIFLCFLFLFTVLSVSQFEYCLELVFFKSMTGLEIYITKFDTDVLENYAQLILKSSITAGEPTTSKHFRRKYWAFAQYCLSFSLISLTSLSFTFFMILAQFPITVHDLINPSFRSLILLFASSYQLQYGATAKLIVVCSAYLVQLLCVRQPIHQLCYSNIIK